MEVTSTISGYEMADLLNMLGKLADGYRLTKAETRLAGELRETIIAGTPEAQRVGR